MFGVNDLITKINTAINSGTATEEEINYLSSAVESLRLYGAATVDTPQDLPNPVTNKGRFFFVQSTNSYVFSDGVRWGVGELTPALPLYGWGGNSSGQLGNNTTIEALKPVSVVGGFNDWVQVSTQIHTVGVRANGTAWAWGSSSFGTLGDNTTVAKSSPVSVVGGFTDWVQVHAIGNHTVGIRANGTAWAWGFSLNGRLGNNNSLTNRSSPVSVVGGFTDWVSVSGNGGFTIGLRANGTAWGWGTNSDGQLGDNTTVNKSSPVSVVGGFTDWVQVSGGSYHCVGIRANGTAWAWGAGGLLGDNTTINKSSPVSVVGGFTDWVQINASNNTVGIRANGTAWAWGNNGYGQLGDNTTIDRSSPVSVVGGFTDWVQVSSDGFHAVGIRANGTAWAWGYGEGGRLGDNTTINKSSPVSVFGGFTDWVQVSASSSSTVGIRAV